MTRSAANCSCDGATMDNPGGALFLRDMPGVLAANCGGSSLSLSEGPSPLADCCSLASMMWRCCSRTLKLRWSCWFMTGSWVTKPGERQAMPTSWMPRLSRADMGTAEAGTLEEAFVFLERSSFRGRGRVFDRVGDPGSFLTTILGCLESARLRREFMSAEAQGETRRGLAYAPLGEDLAAADCPEVLGLMLPTALREAALLAALAAGEATSGVLWADEDD